MPAERMRRKKIIGGAMPNRGKLQARRLRPQSPATAGRRRAARRRHLACPPALAPASAGWLRHGHPGTKEETSSRESLSVEELASHVRTLAHGVR